MRTLSLLALSAVALPLFAACAADPAPETDAVETTDEALAASARKVTTHYEGTFSDSGETFTVALDIELPAAAIGYQRSDSSRFYLDQAGRCRVYNEWTPGSLTLRVTGQGGRVVSEKTERTGTNGSANLDRSECPDGFLLRPRTHASLEAEIMEEGTELEANGRKLHVPRGYFSPGFLVVRGEASFRALSAGKLENKSDSAYNQSDYEIPRGVIRVALPSETTISIGINPSMQGSLGYERTVDVTLRAR